MVSTVLQAMAVSLSLASLFPTVCNDKALTLASQGFVVYGVTGLCASCVGAVMWGYSMMILSPSLPSCLSVVAGLGRFLSLPCSSKSP